MRFLKVMMGLSVPFAAEACTPTIAALAPPPAVVAEATTADERVALAVEVAYFAAGALLEAAVSSGRLTGAAAIHANEVDAQAHRYVKIARAAYDAGNAGDYATAVRRAEPMVAEVRRLAEMVR